MVLASECTGMLLCSMSTGCEFVVNFNKDFEKCAGEVHARWKSGAQRSMYLQNCTARSALNEASELARGMFCHTGTNWFLENGS